MNKKSIMFLSAGLLAGLLIGFLGIHRLATFSLTGAQIASLFPISTSISGANESGTDMDGSASEGASDWCVGHRVPESECTKCNPGLVASFKTKGDWCNEHQLPESHCRICHPDLAFVQEPPLESAPKVPYKPSVFFPQNQVHCASDDAIIQFASATTAERAGITVTPAIEVTETSVAEAPAEIVFDETRASAVTTTVPAAIVRWLVEPGQAVKGGQAIAELESPEMPRLKAEYLEVETESQLKEQERTRADSLRRRDLISIVEFQQIDGSAKTVQARLSGARGLLEAAGLNGDDLKELQDNASVTSRWLLRSPISGSLLERKASLGEIMPSGSRFALIGNPSALWIEAHVREVDLPLFRKAKTIEFAVDGKALDRVSGRVIWVAQFIDPETRTATVRAEVTGEQTNLQAHRFGRISLPASAEVPFVAIPRDAVQWEGCCNIVFVQEAVGRYRPHKVTLTRGDRGYYNISSGLDPGEMVVVAGSYLLKTELKKGSLGVGCCAIEAKPRGSDVRTTY